MRMALAFILQEFTHNYNSFEAGLAILLTNVFIYVNTLALIFTIFYLFDIQINKLLTDFKKFGMNYFVTLSLILGLMSLAGFPPFVGFIGKFMIFLYLILSDKYFWATLAAIYTFFAMFFYLYMNKYIVTNKTTTNYYIVKNFAFINFNFIVLLVLLSFLNLTGLLFFNEIFSFFLYVSSII